MYSVYSSTVFWLVSSSFCSVALAQDKGDFYAYSVFDIEHESVDLEQYRGSVSLVVNVASECGYTDSHYKELVKLQNDLGKDGKFQVLAFPCNQFGKQEPSSDEQIFKYVRTKFDVNFPMFSKIDVTGDKAEPAFAELVAQSKKVPNWNFWKYLVDGRGRVVDAWGPKVSVASIRHFIERQLDSNKTGKIKEDL